MRFTAKDTDRADEICEWTWTWEPKDTLEAVDMLLVYLGVNDRMQTAPVYYPMTPKSEHNLPMRRSLHFRSIGSALALVMPGRRKPNGNDKHWFIYPGTGNSHPKFGYSKSVGERLATAGIDVHSVKVFDNYRWALAWSQLMSKYIPTYSTVKQEELVSANAVAPQIRPKILIHRTLRKEGRERLWNEYFAKKAERERLAAEHDIEPALAPVSEYDQRVMQDYSDRFL